MAQDYLPILVQVIFAAGFAGFALFLSVLIGRVGKRTQIKDTAYECGMLPQGEAQPRFSVKFYIVAMLFVLFDIEVVFLYPWAVIFKDAIAVAGPGIFWWMLSFVTILLVAFVHAWKKGALRWDN